MTIWRVVATQEGQYNQVLRQPGEVFDLLLHEDGTYPPAIKYKPKLDAAGKPIADEWLEEVVMMKDKKTPMHRDFAEDQGDKLVKSGPKRGEVMRFGWMKLVPAKTPLGLYRPETDFWAQNMQLPQPIQVVPDMRDLGPQDRRRNHAPILSHLPPQVEEEAA